MSSILLERFLGDLATHGLHFKFRDDMSSHERLNIAVDSARKAGFILDGFLLIEGHEDGGLYDERGEIIERPMEVVSDFTTMISTVMFNDVDFVIAEPKRDAREIRDGEWMVRFEYASECGHGEC